MTAPPDGTWVPYSAYEKLHQEKEQLEKSLQKLEREASLAMDHIKKLQAANKSMGEVLTSKKWYELKKENDILKESNKRLLDAGKGLIEALKSAVENTKVE